MGYEVKIMIGETGTSANKMLRESKLKIEDGEAWYPYAKDDNGNFIKTDMVETYFMITAEINLCKIGDSHLFKSLKLNKDKLREYYWYGYDGNMRISEDRYGEKADLATIEDCITALKKDVKESDYRRFKWALSLLESMKDSNMKVLWFGY